MMVLQLVRKEFIKSRTNKSSSLRVSFWMLLAKLIFLGGFIALECFTLLSLDKKIMEYSPYGSFDFLVLYNFVALMIALVGTLFKARKILFNQEDNAIMSTLPVGKETIIFSKSICLFLYSSFMLLVLSTPSLLCYSIGRDIYPLYYVFAFIYPLLVSIFVVGLSLIIVPLVEIIYRLIKLSDIAQFIFACALMIGLCFGYQFVLNLFLTALNDSSIGGMFSIEFISVLHGATDYFIPVIHLLNPALNLNDGIVSSIMAFIGESLIFALAGLFVITYFYILLNGKKIFVKQKESKKDELTLLSPTKALIKKEYTLLFKNEAYTFTYTSLLIFIPFLSFAVISSLNGIIYNNLRFFSVYFPELVNGINLTLILLFITVINSSAALSISREDKMLQIVKYLPISPFKQIVIKAHVPIILSFASLFISLIVLISTGMIDQSVFWFGLLFGLILIISDNVLSLEWDMHDKGLSKYKLAGLNNILSIAFPLLVLFIHFIMSFTNCPIYSIYLTESLISLVLLAGCLIKIKARYIKAFNRMEVN